MNATVELAEQLIRRASITPDDKGCQRLVGKRLNAAGFQTETLQFGDVTNLWARHGASKPLFVFLGHTDVVPTGPREQWTHDPFEPVIRDGRLFGRGAADMKGSVAAMVVALERFVKEHPEHGGSVALLLTSDEEGPALDGTVRVMETLGARGEKIDWCLVGEPSSVEQLGDMVKVGRRGSLGGSVKVKGVQGHVAYPHRCANPVHLFAPALAEIVSTQWDQGNEQFPPTTFQVSNVSAGTGASNVVPGDLSVMFNFRYSTESNAESLKHRFNTILGAHALEFEIVWEEGGAEPFLTQRGPFVEAVCEAIKMTTGLTTVCSTEGGTSDGRFVAPTGAQVVELGPTNASIHQIDENVGVDELAGLSSIYELILDRMLDNEILLPRTHLRNGSLTR
jgi:succinyl-diaminopimelate desuccinylase